MEGRQPLINGDGTHSRDFTFVDNAVQANMLALFTEKQDALNQVYNVACGEQTTLNEMVAILQGVSGKRIAAIHGPERAGDVKHSKADISKIKHGLGYNPSVLFADGLRKVFHWYKTQN
jgi:UDP-N-acetylglucosamine 4-epimerase